MARFFVFFFSFCFSFLFSFYFIQILMLLFFSFLLFWPCFFSFYFYFLANSAFSTTAVHLSWKYRLKYVASLVWILEIEPDMEYMTYLNYSNLYKNFNFDVRVFFILLLCLRLISQEFCFHIFSPLLQIFFFFLVWFFVNLLFFWIMINLGSSVSYYKSFHKMPPNVIWNNF